jgi:hypothetical protein
VPILKAGKSGDHISHYRTISLLDGFQKICEILVISKLVDKLEEVSGKCAHFAIRRNGCPTAIEMFYNNAKTFKARGQALGTNQYNCFVDLSHAYDAIDRHVLVKLLILRVGN